MKHQPSLIFIPSFIVPCITNVTHSSQHYSLVIATKLDYMANFRFLGLLANLPKQTRVSVGLSLYQSLQHE